MKNIHATHEWTKKFFNENQPCYERLETLVTQKPIIGGEDDFASTDCLWADTSLRLNNGDIITFHITDTASGKEDYVSVPLYQDYSNSSWGDKGFDTNLDDAWLGYNGIVDENNLYTGVRLVIPQWFNGTVEISRTVLKQLDEKFIPDNVKYTYVSEKLGYATNPNSDGSEMAFSESVAGKIEAGDTLRVVETLNGVTKVHDSLIVPDEMLGTIHGFDYFNIMQILNFGHLYFMGCQPGVQIEVYKMSKVLIADVVAEIDTALNNIISKYGLGGDA